MDVNDLRTVFYVVASIALILVSITVIAIFYLIIRIKKMSDLAFKKVDQMTAEIADQSRNLAKTWERVSVARLFIRILRLIF